MFITNIFEVKLKEFIPDSHKYKFKGKVYLLTNGLVFSSALPFAYMVKDYGLATIVGEETGMVSPAFGEPLKYKLPNSSLIDHPKPEWLTNSINYKIYI